MSRPRRVPGWAVLVSVLGCVTLVACVCTATLGGLYLWRRPLIGIGPAPAPTALPPVNLIVYVGTDGNIYVIAPDGTGKRQLTTDGQGAGRIERAYRFPTWSPDSKRVAYVGLATTGGAAEARLYAAPVDGGAAETLHTASGTAPFYLYWSPDSQQVAFLEQAGNTLALRLATLGQTEVRELGLASPFYFDWAPDSRRLLFHTNSVRRVSPEARVNLFAPGEPAAALSEDPGRFLAPDWSPDGQTLLFARRTEGGGEELVVTETTGTNARPILTYQGAVSFSWAPNGKQIAHIVTDEAMQSGLGQIAFGPIGVVDADGGNPRTLVTDKSLAFFWSPDSTMLAYLTLAIPPRGSATEGALIALPPAQGTPQLRWSVVNVATGEARVVASFDPTEPFISFIPFFDQYARSHRFWSPDSRSLVYTAADDNNDEGVYIIDVAPGSEPRLLAPGIQAGWSWR